MWKHEIAEEGGEVANSEQIVKVFKNIFEKTCIARVPYKIEDEEWNIPALMLYNALLHIHANNLSDLTIFYESKQWLFKTSSLQIISGKNKNKKKYDITKNKQEESKLLENYTLQCNIENLKCKVIAKSESGEILELK